MMFYQKELFFEGTKSGKVFFCSVTWQLPRSVRFLLRSDLLTHCMQDINMDAIKQISEASLVKCSKKRVPNSQSY